MVSKKKRSSEVIEPISNTSSNMKKHKSSMKETELPKSKKPKKEIMKYPYSDEDSDEEEDQRSKQRISINHSLSNISNKRKFEEVKVETPPPPKMEKKSDSSSSESDDGSEDEDEEEEDDEEEEEEEEEDEDPPKEEVSIKAEADGFPDIDEEEEETEIVAPLHTIDPSATPEWPEADLHELISRMMKSLPIKDTLKFESRVEKLDWTAIAFGNYDLSECKNMWLRIQKRVRRFRVLREILDDAKIWVSKPWTSFYRSSKLNRHPDQPRRPLSTYMLFYMEKKDKVAKQNPGLDMTAVSKLIGEMYKKIPENKKKIYSEKAKTIREEYEEKMEIFYRDHPELAQKNEQTEGRARRNEAKPPIKPKTPFMLFLNEQMTNQKDNPGYDKNSIKEKCREMWRTMSEKKKVAWINWALEAEVKYKENLKTYIFKNPNFKPPAVKSLLTKEEKLIVERLAGKPVKPPNSGYSLFSRIMLASAEIKQVDSKQRMSKISSLWKTLPDADKKDYQEQVIHMLDQYKLEYATYLESLPEEKRREELLSSFPKRKMSATKPRSSKPKPKSSAIATVKPTKASKQKIKEDTPTSPTLNTSVVLYKGEPPPPPLNTYHLYKQIYMKKKKVANSAKLESELSHKWKMVHESEKSKYTRELNEIKDKYIKDFEKFLRSLSQEELKEYSSLKKPSQSDDLSSSHSNSESSEEEDDDDNDDNDNDEEEADDPEEVEENNENGDQNSDEEENDSESSQDESVHNSNKTSNSTKEVKSTSSASQNKSNQESDDSSSSSSSSGSSCSSDSDDSD